jgi:hypothetical protein
VKAALPAEAFGSSLTYMMNLSDDEDILGDALLQAAERARLGALSEV